MEPECSFRTNDLESEIRTLVLDLEGDVGDLRDLEVGTRSPDVGQMSRRGKTIAPEVAVITLVTWSKEKKK